MSRGVESSRALWQKSWPAEGVQHFDPVFDLLDRIKFERLEAHLPSGGRAIEVGSGSGRLAAHLTTRGFDAVCLDYTMEALVCARRSWTASVVKGRGARSMSSGREVSPRLASFRSVRGCPS